MASTPTDDGLFQDRPTDPKAESRSRFMIVAGAAVAVLLLLIVPVIGGGYYVMDDLGRQILPLRIYYVDHAARGESIAWTPHLFGGFYLLGDGHLGLFHPAMVLLYRAAPLHHAFTTEVLIRYPLVLVGTLLLLRRWGLPADAALFGGATLAFGGFFLMHLCHVPHCNVAAHLPWQLLACDVLFRDGSARRVRWAWLAIALLAGSQWLIGFPSLAYMTSQAEVIYILTLGARGQVRRRRLVAWVLAKVLGGLIGSAQILPMLETLPLSVRSDLSLSAVLSESLHPLDLLQLFSPYWFSGRGYYYQGHAPELSLYCGSVATVLAAWALIRSHRLGPLRSRIGVAMAFAVVGLLFAMGRFGGLALLQYYPVFSLRKCTIGA